MQISFHPSVNFTAVRYPADSSGRLPAGSGWGRAALLPQDGRRALSREALLPGGEKQVFGSEAPTKSGQGAWGAEKAGRQEECQTCKNRKYVDGSEEGNVSFKAPGHIAPEASASVVMAHEKQHVANAVREGGKPGNELVSVSVSLKTAVCPECGRAYVAGGTTRTMIRYGGTPFEKNRKSADYARYAGVNFDRRS